MHTYGVWIERDGKGWEVSVPEVERVTAARNLREVEVMARDLIALMTDTEPDSFDIDIQAISTRERELLDEIDDLEDRLSVHEAAGDTVPLAEVLAELESSDGPAGGGRLR